MNIAVLFGGISPERNVSIAGGKAVATALRDFGYNVYPIDPAYGTDGLRTIEEMELSERFPTNEELSQFNTKKILECINSPLFDIIDAVFIVLHGINGEDGKIQALLELRGIPYTGSKVKASALAIDKIASKMLFLAAGIQTPPWIPVRKKDYDNYEFFETVRSELGNEIVVKPNDQGSTIGISIIDSGNLDDIRDGIQKASKYSDTVVVEQYIAGRELTVGIVGGEALPVIEIVPQEGYYDYEHKYTKGKTEYICPAELDEDMEEFIQTMAVSAFQVLGCSGFGRADFRLDEDGGLYILEMNTIPGFTATSLVPKAAAAVDIDFPELCEMIINIAIGKDEELEEEEEKEE